MLQAYQGYNARYLQNISSEQRESLIRLISIGKDSARKLTRARVLLKADESEGAAAYAAYFNFLIALALVGEIT